MQAHSSNWAELFKSDIHLANPEDLGAVSLCGIFMKRLAYFVVRGSKMRMRMKTTTGRARTVTGRQNRNQNLSVGEHRSRRVVGIQSPRIKIAFEIPTFRKGMLTQKLDGMRVWNERTCGLSGLDKISETPTGWKLVKRCLLDRRDRWTVSHALIHDKAEHLWLSVPEERTTDRMERADWLTEGEME